MLGADQEKLYLKRFAAAKASLRLEGMDPTQDPLYRAAKESVLRGEMTAEQALADAVEAMKKLHRHAAIA
jgi:hypothetical protein